MPASIANAVTPWKDCATLGFNRPSRLRADLVCLPALRPYEQENMASILPQRLRDCSLSARFVVKRRCRHMGRAMHWVRANRRIGAWVALFALSLQLVLSFGHVHAHSAAFWVLLPSASRHRKWRTAHRRIRTVAAALTISARFARPSAWRRPWCCRSPRGSRCPRPTGTLGCPNSGSRSLPASRISFSRRALRPAPP